METSHPIPAVSATSAAASPLPQQFRQMLRAVVVLAILMAAVQSLEMWRCWQTREAAHRAAQLRANMQQLFATIEEYRRASARYPDLIAIGRKYGVEPLAAGSNSPAVSGSATTNRAAGRP